jgi:hypothetical protein
MNGLKVVQWEMGFCLVSYHFDSMYAEDCELRSREKLFFGSHLSFKDTGEESI